MSATDELRRLLDERGMEHFDRCEVEDRMRELGVEVDG